MKRSIAALIATLALAAPATAGADFGLNNLQATYNDSAGAPETDAGAHPAESITVFNLNTRVDPNTALTLVDGGLRDLAVSLPAGFAGNATAVDTCEMADFLRGNAAVGRATACPNDTVVGYLDVRVSGGIGIVGEEIDPLYNLIPPPGMAAMFGAVVGGEPQLVEVVLNPDPPHNLIAQITDTTQIVEIRGSDTVVWGNPASPDNDTSRGPCAVTDTDSNEDPFDDDVCESDAPETAYLTMPRSCADPLITGFFAQSWWSGDPQSPDPAPASFSDTAPSDGTTDCAALGFSPTVTAAPTTNVASAPSGFEFGIEIDDPKLTDPTQRADSDLKQAVVTLPEGMAVNAAAAGGLAACSAAQLAQETPSSDFGAGCPAASRVASVEVTTPLLAEPIAGSIFLATPYTNPLGTLLAGYLVLKQPQRGIVVRLTGKIETNPNTGQITASFDQNPQLPFDDLQVSFFGGAKGPLSTPDACGDYEVKTELHPWSGNAPDVSTQPFTIAAGPGGAPCPTSAAQLPHNPSFDAGSVTPIAGAHSPFVVNLRREDGSQRFKDVTLSPPPGLTAKLAGTAICSEAALAAAAARPGVAEQASPSCPLASQVGSVQAAAGTGPAPYWAPGTAYLTGPYKSAPLSMAIVTPAVAGPFDLGVVVVRTALHVDPVSAEITAVSDPLPEFLEGIPLDIRQAIVRLDKPDFALNGTSCDPMAVNGLLTSTLNQVAQLSSRFQLAECTRLGFKPRMTLKLRGGTKRGKHPALTIALMPRAGDANIASVSVALPRSEFLENAHIRTICTRPDFAADACPSGAIYGEATVDTQLLDYDLAGHIYLRSSDNLLPDVVPDLRGPAYQPIKLETAGRTDSIRGGIRTTIDFVPDAPFTKAVVALQGGNKGLLVNSRDICARAYRATVRYTAHNGRTHIARPKLVAQGCKKKGNKSGKKAKRGGHKRAKQVAHRSAVR